MWFFKGLKSLVHKTCFAKNGQNAINKLFSMKLMNIVSGNLTLLIEKKWPVFNNWVFGFLLKYQYGYLNEASQQAESGLQQ